MAHIRCRRCGDPVPANADKCPKCGAPPPVDETLATVAAKTRFKVGDVIDSRYEVVAVLPTGGMGELYKVRHIHLGDFRVVKIRKPNARGDETGSKRFIREAKLAAAIKHTNLASLFDFAQLEDGSFYMVNEYVDGMTIAEHIRAGGRFEVAQVLRIAEQALRALEAIHTAGIVHRDVASDNLMLAQDGSGQTIVKLIDLGIAKALDGEGLTSTGYFVGKARYASPEQVNTQDPEPIDQRSDLYSLGIVLYEMLSGDVPFAASTPAASVIKRLTSEVTAVTPRDASIIIDTTTEAIVLRLLRRERDERFASASEALRDVRGLIAERPNYESEATLSRITRDRELFRVAGAPEASGAVSGMASRVAAPPSQPPRVESKVVPTGTVEMSLDDLKAMGEDDEQPLAVAPVAADEPIEPTEAVPLIPRGLREQLIASAESPSAASAPAPPSARREDEPAETMPFQKWQQSQAPTVAAPLPEAPRSPSQAPIGGGDQEDIPTVATGQMRPTVPQPLPPALPSQPSITIPPPPSRGKAQPPQPPAAPSQAATRPAPAPQTVAKKGTSTKTIVIFSVVVIFALGALSLAGYAAWQLYKRYAASHPSTPGVSMPATSDTTTTAQSTDSGEVQLIESTTTPTATESAATTVDSVPTDTTSTVAPTPATDVPETPKPPAKSVKKREKPAPPPVEAPPVKVAPEPEPEPAVSEGDLVEPGSGVVDARLITKQPLRLSLKEKLKRTRGSATVGFIIGINGVPENTEILESSGDAAIDAAALRAAAASRYTPATKDGVKVRVRAALAFSNEKQQGDSQ